MKIISWNCQMAFRKKAEYLLQYNPDIIVVQECEHPNKIEFKSWPIQPISSIWLGENKNKGLGIFSFAGHRLKLCRSHNGNFKLIAPIKIIHDQHNFMLYAIWAHNPGDPDGRYITQVWKALKHYDKTIKKKNTILMGDFNSNTIWDRPRREGNHSSVVERLKSKNIHSVYHKHFVQEQGKEIHPTFYLYKNRNKPYHIDYCFASNDLIEKLVTVEIGDFDSWTRYSDHVPVIVTFNSETSTETSYDKF